MADFVDIIEPAYVPEVIPHSAASAGDHTNVLILSYVEGVPAGSNTPPTVSYVTPGGVLNPTDPIVVDVIDTDSPAPSTFLFARFAVSGGVEVVWDGTAFAPFYGTSSRVPIANGHRYTLLRSGGGWIAGGITINANAIDDSGGAAT